MRHSRGAREVAGGDFMYNERKRRILRHLTLGGGDSENCLQIYFEPDIEPAKMVVAYCGRHLPYDRGG